MPEEMHPVLEGKCIDSENENLQRSIKQYKYHIEQDIKKSELFIKQ